MYEIYAISVAEREVDSPVFLRHTDYGKKVLLVYYFWCLRGMNHTILVDTGISGEECEKRGLTGVPTREELLSRIGIRPAEIDTIILSHLHDDHFAHPEIYTQAIFYIQRKEVEFWSGEVQRFNCVASMVNILPFHELNMAGRVRFLDGDSEIYPGLSVLRFGGHTPGQQLVNVNTDRGDVLLCVDFAAMYRNLEEKIPIGHISNLVEWMKGIGRIERMALPKESVIPGHDSSVMTKFRKIAEGIVKIA